MSGEDREGEPHSTASGDLVLYTDEEGQKLVKKLGNFGLEYVKVTPVQFLNMINFILNVNNRYINVDN